MGHAQRILVKKRRNAVFGKSGEGAAQRERELNFYIGG